MIIRKHLVLNVTIALLLCSILAVQPFVQVASNVEMEKSWNRLLENFLRMYQVNAQELHILMSI